MDTLIDEEEMRTGRVPPLPTRFDANRFVDNLDNVRQSRRLVWQAVAELAGVSASVLYQFVRERHNLTIHNLISLAQWADMSIDDYMIPVIIHEDGMMITQSDVKESGGEWKRFGFGRSGGPNALCGIVYTYQTKEWEYRAHIIASRQDKEKSFELRVYEAGGFDTTYVETFDEWEDAVMVAYREIAHQHNKQNFADYIYFGLLANSANQIRLAKEGELDAA